MQRSERDIDGTAEGRVARGQVRGKRDTDGGKRVQGTKRKEKAWRGAEGVRKGVEGHTEGAQRSAEDDTEGTKYQYY